jgi:hypothetical protein
MRLFLAGLITLVGGVLLASSASYSSDGGAMTLARHASLSKVPNVEVSVVEQRRVSRVINESRALDVVWKLTEVKQKAKEIAALSKGKVSLGAMVSDEPPQNKRYYTIQVFEQHPDRIATIWFFRVDKQTGNVAVLNPIDDVYVPLRRWRELQRQGNRK